MIKYISIALEWLGILLLFALLTWVRLRCLGRARFSQGSTPSWVRKGLELFLLVGAVTALDRYSKSFFYPYMDSFAQGALHPVWITQSHFFGLVHWAPCWNAGVSYGLFSGVPFVRFLIFVLVAAVMLYLTKKYWACQNLWQRLGFALIVAGAMGNVLDRALYGAVLDFISLSLGMWRSSVFNVADLSIIGGFALLASDHLGAHLLKRHRNHP